MQSQSGAPAHLQQPHPTSFPVPPRIPLQTVQTLIPRLTTTINDIDAFQRVLVETGVDGSLPNWDALLQRYSLLLGRINGLAQTISQLPPTPISTPARPRPALENYIVHPLNALTSDSDPMAPDIFFQVINTQLIPSVKTSHAELLSPPEWADTAELKRMNVDELGVVERRLEERLSRESITAKKILEEIQTREDEVDWTMRIGGDDDAQGDGDDENDNDNGKDKDKDKEDDEDEDLFGDNDDEPVVVVPADGKKEPLPPNPRDGWTLADYGRYMDTGKEPIRQVAGS
ncbi:hypothetical protein BCR39DRAFT_587576 [Naematelia encephala]|uniref:Mediator of RNA polymerase II transcription subunit 8 n=1 Tax=Naematelia encephala TaxID=71784 RepID=A0A1Y2B915_9TREE|nr:hypothetical protein BCR39DRAFT_587576 [Naematelia encephala]